jgi:hypothetical protein
VGGALAGVGGALAGVGGALGGLGGALDWVGGALGWAGGELDELAVRAASTLCTETSPATRSGSMSRRARESTNAPSRAASMATVSSRAVSGVAPARSKRSAPRLIQLSKTSAQAWRIVSLVLDTSSATVAIGHASSYSVSRRCSAAALKKSRTPVSTSGAGSKTAGINCA